MISRREFLKLSGIASAALVGGFSAGKFFGESVPHFYLAALVPADEYAIKKSLEIFYEKIRLSTKPVIETAGNLDRIISNHSLQLSESYEWKNADIVIKVRQIKAPAGGDILLSGENKFISAPDEFSSSIKLFRDYLQTKEAKFLLTAECKKHLYFSFAENKIAVVENENGIVDKINLASNYSRIEIPGRNGNLISSVIDGKINIVKSPCRHKICTMMNYAANRGDYIACAPNKVLIRIENA